MKILLTGFTPFPGVDHNPSQLIVQQIKPPGGIDLVTQVLPTSFERAGECIRALIHETKPDVVVSVGVAAGRNAINLERFALNVNDAPKPDNDGVLATGQPIADDGPLAYRSLLPLEAMYNALMAAHIPVIYSNHAGAYVCNHVFYCARHEIESHTLNIPSGFIHIPMMSEAQDQKGAEVGLPLAMMTEAVTICLRTIAAQA